MKNFTKLVNQAMTEKAPPGFEGTVKKMKKDKDIDNPWALAWWMKNRGEKSHIKSNGKRINESFRVEHPRLGYGTVTELTKSQARIKWDSLASWTKHPELVTIKEALSIIVVDSDKYLRNQLSEETDMSETAMTAMDFISLMEEEIKVSKPSDAILTKQSTFKSDAGDSSLASLGNADAKSTDFDAHEENKKADGAPGAPSFQSMGEKPKSGGSSKVPDSGKDDSSVYAGMGNKKTDDSGSTAGSDNKDKDMTFEDFDIEGDYDEGDDEMTSGDISVTQDFMFKLLQGVSQANLDDDALTTITDCIASCSDEGTLGVDDIDTVMSSMREKVEDVSAGDGEPAGPEGGPDHEGDTQLMGDMEECDDMEEGSEEDRRNGHDRWKNKQADKRRFRNKDKMRPKYSKSKRNAGPMTESRKQLDEAWLAAIPNVGNPRVKADYSAMSEEDAELAEIKRLAGMTK